MKVSTSTEEFAAGPQTTGGPEAMLDPKNRSAHINAAVRLLHDGRLVSFPTETVYGLGGDAANPTAVQRIFQLKGRPANHPLIVHLADAQQLDKWARDIPAAAWKLAERFWPGPLTLILKKAAGVPLQVTGGQDTIGLRIPAHPLALELLKTFGGGLAAPSANRFGRISPTRAEHVRQEFADNLELVLDGGSCHVGVESTILSLVTEEPVLLRPGGISVGQLAEVLGYRPGTPARTADDIRVPGLLPSHYAPVTPLEVETQQSIWLRARQLQAQDLRVALMIFAEPPVEVCPTQRQHVIEMPNEPEAYARSLYHTMRTLDRGDYDRLLVEAPPETEAWSAINNRLLRAAAYRKITGEITDDKEQL